MIQQRKQVGRLFDKEIRPSEAERSQRASIPGILRTGRLLGPLGLLLVCWLGLALLALEMWRQQSPTPPGCCCCCC